MRIVILIGTRGLSLMTTGRLTLTLILITLPFVALCAIAALFFKLYKYLGPDTSEEPPFLIEARKSGDI
jgi:hypothetical protein